ncbi:MAG: hypothetical protein ACI9ZT_001734 [Gammaproteobacteria bacterium]|jgi:hypothetical protein
MAAEYSLSVFNTKETTDIKKARLLWPFLKLTMKTYFAFAFASSRAFVSAMTSSATFLGHGM